MTKPDRNRGQSARTKDNPRFSDTNRSTNMEDSPMMAHLLKALKSGQDIGQYGCLTYVMGAILLGIILSVVGTLMSNSGQ